jgi:hydroxymethylpyrimidine kinase/phosphomethylpyrimidine kinase
MLPTAETIEVTAELLRRNHVNNLVVDPVVKSTSGYDLIDDKALSVLVAELFPLADLVTPNLLEAERLTGFEIATIDDIQRAGRAIQALGARNVLIKGGHVRDSAEKAIDHLFTDRGTHLFEADRINTTATHGTGCTLSAAIAANLALGLGLKEAVGAAKWFVTEAIRSAPHIGHGHSPINQLIKSE